MPEISISLVRKCHSEVDVNDLHLLDVLRLSNQGITFIDNLEVFSNVKVLFLNGNSIRIIENLEYLTVLDHLDISNNNIDAESLTKSLANIPRNLNSINLTNNPCCSDEVCLQQLQDRFPELGIIIGVENNPGESQSINADILNQRANLLNIVSDTAAILDRTNQDSKSRDESDDERDDDDDDDDDEEDTPVQDDFTLGSSEVIDADSLLKTLVERKCRLQNLGIENSVEKALSVKVAVNPSTFCSSFLIILNIISDIK